MSLGRMIFVETGQDLFDPNDLAFWLADVLLELGGHFRVIFDARHSCGFKSPADRCQGPPGTFSSRHQLGAHQFSR